MILKIFCATFSVLMSESNNNNSGGFAKTTDFKWFGIGVLIFILIGLLLPTPESMLAKAKDIFGSDPSIDVALKATHIQLTIALLATCVVFFATFTCGFQHRLQSGWRGFRVPG